MSSGSIDHGKARAPIAPAALYVGRVLHARLRPKPHRFLYRVYMMLLDLDRLDAADQMSRHFSVGRFNLLSFVESDHLLPQHSAGPRLSERAKALFAERGIDSGDCKIMLLCYPRVLGYAFNPLSVFYAVDKSGLLRGFIYEVRNTFGGRHVYVASAGEQVAVHRHAAKKQFHVSPFLPMNLEYRFNASSPDETLKLRIMEYDEDGPLLSAGFAGTAMNFTNLNALRAFFGLPMMTLKVILAIHYEALLLYLKGLRVYPSPNRGR